MNLIPRCKGVYLLVMVPKSDSIARIGRSGIEIDLRPDTLLIYVGSAMGPGGLRARIRRHLTRSGKKLYWHIDYLTSRPDIDIGYILYACTTHKEAEKDLAERCSRILEKGPHGFGSGDDPYNRTHLFVYRGDPIILVENLLPGCFRDLGLFYVLLEEK
ncbi:MAG: GIY-YIG nuclease family protein [Desulfurococcales archaeon]|nr:GIY-YIG nuclease family protein [Desulfurococcales archaeon]